MPRGFWFFILLSRQSQTGTAIGSYENRALLGARYFVLAADAEALDEVLIAGLILALEVIQQLAALCDHHQETTTTMVVFLVGLEMLGQRGDPRGQDCDLHFGRTCVAFFGCEFLDNAVFFCGSNRHRGLLA
ncbi:hypothetical protein RV134_260343 [Roseovarius sp. EC-HK134]|nr:hypothetical protein RV134_260343 [Roseovarius sp. EC-HK134]VVT11122.1 hypothetical protein RV420_290558 [Roseovarius sp. EC-SD190]